MGDKAIRIAESTTDNLADYGKPKYRMGTLIWSELNNRYKTTDIADISTDEAESILATQDVKERFALLKLSQPDSHIIGVGFRSDYDGVDRPNVTFFYVLTHTKERTHR